jgi:hypothetical protein
MRRIMLTLLIVLSMSFGGVLSSAHVPGQAPPPGQQSKREAEVKEALEQKIQERMAQCLTLVVEAEQIVKNTSRASSRALGYIALGEALWEHDRERGRGHLRSAFGSVSQVPLDESWPDRQQTLIPGTAPVVNRDITGAHGGASLQGMAAKLVTCRGALSGHPCPGSRLSGLRWCRQTTSGIIG